MARPKSYDGTTRAKVLRWWRRGKAVAWIATRIGISDQAVRYHLRRLEDDGEIDDAPTRDHPRRSA